MRRWVFVGIFVLFALFTLLDCGGDSPSGVEFDCSCAATCDGTEVVESATLCGRPGNLQEAIDAQVSACVGDLAESCFSYECSCECVEAGADCD